MPSWLTHPQSALFTDCPHALEPLGSTQKDSQTGLMYLFLLLSGLKNDPKQGLLCRIGCVCFKWLGKREFISESNYLMETFSQMSYLIFFTPDNWNSREELGKACFLCKATSLHPRVAGGISRVRFCVLCCPHWQRIWICFIPKANFPGRLENKVWKP